MAYPIGTPGAAKEAVVEKYKQLFNRLLPEGWQLTDETNKVSWDEKLDMGRYTLKDVKNNVIASFELYPMINCCGICVSTKAMVAFAWQHKGIGTLLNSFRVDLARHLGYGLLLCTDVETNEYQRKVLAKNGWKDLYKFVNPRTRNSVFISAINL
jgi:hypothetical protein